MGHTVAGRSCEMVRMATDSVPPPKAGRPLSSERDKPAVPSRPAWMRAKADQDAAAAEDRLQPPPLPASARLNATTGSAPPENSAPDQPRRFSRKWWLATLLAFFLGDLFRGFGVSLLLHSFMLAAMGMIVYSVESQFGGVVIDARLSAPVKEDGFETVLDTQLSKSDSAPPSPVFEVPVEMLAGQSTAMMEDTLQTQGGAGENGEEGADGEMEADVAPRLKVPASAVTKGSFTAWTDPEDPAPGMAYRIVIQVVLPEKITRYRPGDLRGMVIGTDGYKQAIHFQNREPVPVVDGKVQFELRVPGAQKLVKDMIRVESRMLREKQVLELVF